MFLEINGYLIANVLELVSCIFNPNIFHLSSIFKLEATVKLSIDIKLENKSNNVRLEKV